MVVDPKASPDDMPLLAERLARAGLLAPWPPAAPGTRPDDGDLAQAGRAATGGKPLADYVAEGRG